MTVYFKIVRITIEFNGNVKNKNEKVLERLKL